jgi:hypothetical protein
MFVRRASDTGRAARLFYVTTSDSHKTAIKISSSKEMSVKIKKNIVSIVAASLVFAATSATASAQTQDEGRNRVARGNNLTCAGYIQTANVNVAPEVVGGEQEQEQRVYTQGDFIYMRGGANAGIRENDRFRVTRPRGRFRSPFSRKGDLGIYVQEVATARVVRVKSEVSVLEIENACETVLLGDLLVPANDQSAPLRREQRTLDRFADPTGKANGRIVLARDSREALARDQIVYIDLGAEDGIKSGDYLTIYRPLGRGKISRYDDEQEVARPEDAGFESTVFRGGKFSNQAPRKKFKDAEGPIASTRDVKLRRPRMPRKIVGEIVILNVKERTATAVITQTAQEIHTGDYVELQ